MKHECQAVQLGGQKCRAEAKWWVGDEGDDPQRACERHATLARRHGWPVRRILATSARPQKIGTFLAAVKTPPNRKSLTEDDSVRFEFAAGGRSVVVEFFEDGDIAAVAGNGETARLFDGRDPRQAARFVEEELGKIFTGPGVPGFNLPRLGSAGQRVSNQGPPAGVCRVRG